LFKKICFFGVKLIGVNHGHNPKRSVGTDFAITINSATKRKVIEYGQDIDKVLVLPHSLGVDNGVDSIVNDVSIGSRLTIGSYGRFSFEKGYDVLLQSLRILHDQGIDFSCKIGGTGCEEKMLIDFVLNNNLEERVEFVGWIVGEDAKKNFFDGIDLFISPSRKEEFGLVILEAQKYRTVVLSTRCDGPADIINNGVTGFLVGVDPIEMANKIKFIIKNKDLLKKVESYAYDKLIKTYSYKSFRSSLGKIIRCL
jgi:glycosyltransferase involved in cell wall biosynthesis